MRKLIPKKLYGQIQRVMPIPCVDLIISNLAGQVLLIKRKDEPAKNQWWFPGGRVHFLELRKDAAKRKLKEECGLKAAEFVEIGTFDLILAVPGKRAYTHGITTLFHIRSVGPKPVELDGQSWQAQWKKADEWLSLGLHPFVASGIKLVKPRIEKGFR